MFKHEVAKAHTLRSSWFLAIAALVASGLMLSHLLPKDVRPTMALRAFLMEQKNCPVAGTFGGAMSGGTDLTNGLPTFSSIRVVSLPNRAERRAHMRKLDGYLHLGLQFSDAVLYTDPRVTEIVKRVGNRTKADNHIAEVGHVACRMSHRRAIEAAEAADEETTLILEDDVDFETAFKYLAGTVLRDVPAGWDMIFFGHTDFSDESRHGRDPRANNMFIYKSVEPQGGHAYALSRQGRKLLLGLLDNKRPEVFETDEGQPIDEIFAYLARLNRGNLYSIIPDMVVQRALFASDIIGTPAGFDDGMHSKPLLDSALKRILNRDQPHVAPVIVEPKKTDTTVPSRLFKKA